MQPVHDQTLRALLREELPCYHPNGLFLFAKILLLSGALALERFVQIRQDDFMTFLLQGISDFESFGQFFLPAGVTHSWLCDFTLNSLKWYHCSPQIQSMNYTIEFKSSLKLPGFVGSKSWYLCALTKET